MRLQTNEKARKADYDKEIELNPRDALSYNNRGVANRKKGQHDRAIADHHSFEIIF